ncbi:MAG: single-stranded-DNA-specific exonuclease RecJ [Bacteroidales bacterium]
MGLEKKWIEKNNTDSEEIKSLADELEIDQVLSKLLRQRGISSYQEAKTFFQPSLDSLYDPFLMKDMDKAVSRLEKAIQTKENILVYGDYDVDGTTAVALVYSFVKNFSENVYYYIPDRYEEGSGISYKGIDWAGEHDYSLIIALDCGIKSVDKIEYATEKDIDFIICDHHLEGDILPPAVAVLDPKRKDSTYPFDDLAGCGVGFKLIQAYAQNNNLPFNWVTPYLDFVAVSIASDLVSITGENRILAHFGLKRLNESPSEGLHSIIKLSGLEHHVIKIDDIVFKIGPRINAAGRMGSGMTAVDLLVARDNQEAERYGNKISGQNKDRKSVDKKITLEALSLVKESKTFKKDKAIVVFKTGWHKGVLGIVASRLVEAYYKPTIVLTEINGYLTGSARSIKGFDLYEAIESCSEYLENFGGHMYAAGLTLKRENLEAFTKKFEIEVASKITNKILTPIIHIDAELNFKQITPKFFRILKQFQPFGPGNVSPVFVTKNVYDNGNGRIVGAKGEHIKLELIQEDEPYRCISAIAFKLSEYFDHIRQGNPIDICYTIAENYYRGIANIQLRIIDIRPGKDSNI